MATIGETIRFKGDLTGDEDLEVLGQVEGKIELPDHQLTIGKGGRVDAEVNAKSVLIIGSVKGNVTATERLEVQASGTVEGDIRAPRLIIQEGAAVNGAIEMSQKPAAATASTTSKASTPAAPALASRGVRA